MLAVRPYTLGSTRIVDHDGIPCIVLTGILTAAAIYELKAHTAALAADDPVVIADWRGLVLADSPANLAAALDDGRHVMRQPVALVIRSEQAPVARAYARIMTGRSFCRPVFLTRSAAAEWCRQELATRLDEALHQTRCRGQSGGLPLRG